MTHDELLAILKPTDTNFPIKSPIQVLNALRAVVELHKPNDEPTKSGWFEGREYKEGYVVGCSFDNYHYPCPTIQAITDQLK